MKPVLKIFFSESRDTIAWHIMVTDKEIYKQKIKNTSKKLKIFSLKIAPKFKNNTPKYFAWQVNGELLKENSAIHAFQFNKLRFQDSDTRSTRV